MSGADLRRLEDLYAAAMSRPAAERIEYAAAACGDDLNLRRRLERMVADAGEASQFMESPAHAPIGGDGDGPAGEDPLIGRHVGRYLILRVIGLGGMGVVYEAQQDSPNRKVALKLLRPGWVSRSLLRRFELETEVLGRLSHPGIAQIYEAGSVEIGGLRQPFFAMELVDGRPITRYASEQKLSARQRQELIVRVCDALEHAHQKGVIHRDLKPGNILVDQSGLPKLLDFGVARATNADIVATTMRTHAGQIVGTIAYMSPEQARGRAADLDTRSDVYSLGVLLFELLAGRLPHDVTDRTIPEAVRTITEDEPSHLSTIDRSLRGDVETIVAKALEKDKARRYQSAAELAADLRRHLNDEPITARPASTYYQLSKFAKRNKGLVGGVVAAFVVLAGALVGVSIQAARLNRAKVRAEEAAWFMQSVLSAADPYPTITGASLPKYFGANARVVDVLDEVVKRLDEHQLRDPVAEAKIRQMMSMCYFGVARFEDGAVNARRALELLRPKTTETDPLVLASKIGLACNMAMLMDSREAERIANDAVEGCVRAYTEHHEETLRALQCLWLCYTYAGYTDDCAKVTERMLDIVRTSPRTLNYATFSIKAEQAASLVASRRTRAGRALAQQALAEGVAADAERTHWVAYTRFVLARAAFNLSEIAEAENEAMQGLEIWTATSGDIGAVEFQAESGIYISTGFPVGPQGSDEDDAAYTQRRLDVRTGNAERREKGLKIIADAAALARTRLGPNAPFTARLTYRHAQRLWEFRLADRAEEQYREFFASTARGNVPDTHLTALAKHEFASVLAAQATAAEAASQRLTAESRHDEAADLIAKARTKWEEAERSLREGIRIADSFTRKQWIRHHWDDRVLLTSLGRLLHSQKRESEIGPLIAKLAERTDEHSDPWDANDVAWWLFEQGRPDLCEPIARRAVNDWRRLHGQGEGPFTYPFVMTLDTWAAALRAQGHLDKAEAAWREGETAWMAEPERVPQYYRIALRHGECLTDLGKFDQAEVVFLRTLAGLRGGPPVPDPEAFRTVSSATAAMYEAWGKPEQAAAHRAAGN